MLRRSRTAALISAVLLAALFGPACADDGTDIPKSPDLGTTSSATVPPLGNISGIGKGPGGTSPAKIRKVFETARSDRTDNFRGPGKQDPLRKLGRSVVLLVTPTKLGSATLVDRNGTFVTSWHIVGNEQRVGIIYMPLDRDRRPTEADAVQANVVRVDPETDLALVRVSRPERDVKPIALTDSRPTRTGASLQVLGHPYGDIWTYTKGTLKAVEKKHTWTSEDGTRHVADIVSFQTRSITGNSGGPVLDGQNRLLAIDTMRSDEKSMLAIAVSVSEVRRLLTATPRKEVMRALAKPEPAAAMSRACEPARLETRRTRAGDGTVHVLDLNCNGHEDARLLVPDNAKLADVLVSDANENGLTDSIYFDFDRDGRFDEVRFDTDEDGKADLVGRDLDTDLIPQTVRVIAR